MSPSSAGGKFVIEGDFLFVRGQLGIEDEKLYSEALFALLKSGHDMVHVDFSALDYVSSSYIGATGLMIMMAKEKNIVPNLIVSEKVARTFQLAGLDQIVNMRIVHAKKE
jgi:anti-anti-sigma regulatory factor